MSRLLELYPSVEALLETLFRGNEIELLYKGEGYFLLPKFDSSGKQVIGVIVGNARENCVIQTKEELCLAPIGGSPFGDIISALEVTWYNFL